jgi:hypothetical protein
MNAMEVPALQCLLTYSDVKELDDRMLACMTSSMRICACCEAAALGLQSCASMYRQCSRHVDTNGRA